MFASIYVLLQTGHSIDELANSSNNQAIIEVLRQNRPILKQEGQFVHLLSGHLQKDDEKSIAKKQVHGPGYDCLVLD